MRSGLAALIEINAERRLAIIGGTRARIGGGRSRPSLAKRLESRLPAPRLWGYPACRSLCTRERLNSQGEKKRIVPSDRFTRSPNLALDHSTTTPSRDGAELPRRPVSLAGF